MIILRIGTEKRTGSKIDSAIPGPGQYNSTLTTLGSATKYTFRLKTQSQMDLTKFSCSPGPGNYTPNFDVNFLKQPSFSMRIRPNTARSESNVPGPGQYALRKEKDFDVPSYRYILYNK